MGCVKVVSRLCQGCVRVVSELSKGCVRFVSSVIFLQSKTIEKPNSLISWCLQKDRALGWFQRTPWLCPTSAPILSCSLHSAPPPQANTTVSSPTFHFGMVELDFRPFCSSSHLCFKVIHPKQGRNRLYIFRYCPKHCFRLNEGQQYAGVGVKISWVKQQFEILPALGHKPLSPGMGTWNAASRPA